MVTVGWSMWRMVMRMPTTTVHRPLTMPEAQLMTLILDLLYHGCRHETRNRRDLGDYRGADCSLARCRRISASFLRGEPAGESWRSRSRSRTAPRASPDRRRVWARPNSTGG